MIVSYFSRQMEQLLEHWRTFWAPKKRYPAKSDIVLSRNCDGETSATISETLQRLEKLRSILSTLDYQLNLVMINLLLLPISWREYKKELQVGRTFIYLYWANRSAVLSTLPLYAMQCFLIPKKIINRATSLIKQFWWKGSGKSVRGIHWVKSDILFHDKDSGGI